MSDDLLSRMRQVGGNALRVPLLALLKEAADEIERLRDHVKTKHDEILLLRAAMEDRDDEADHFKAEIERLRADRKALVAKLYKLAGIEVLDE